MICKRPINATTNANPVYSHYTRDNIIVLNIHTPTEDKIDDMEDRFSRN
jgi:hypothetical protein